MPGLSVCVCLNIIILKMALHPFHLCEIHKTRENPKRGTFHRTVLQTPSLPTNLGRWCHVGTFRDQSPRQANRKCSFWGLSSRQEHKSSDSNQIYCLTCRKVRITPPKTTHWSGKGRRWVKRGDPDFCSHGTYYTVVHARTDGLKEVTIILLLLLLLFFNGFFIYLFWSHGTYRIVVHAITVRATDKPLQSLVWRHCNPVFHCKRLFRSLACRTLTPQNLVLTEISA